MSAAYIITATQLVTAIRPHSVCSVFDRFMAAKECWYRILFRMRNTLSSGSVEE